MTGLVRRVRFPKFKRDEQTKYQLVMVKSKASKAKAGKKGKGGKK
jgi:hypothetical protein